jgi:hypothetical protein
MKSGWSKLLITGRSYVLSLPLSVRLPCIYKLSLQAMHCVGNAIFAYCKLCHDIQPNEAQHTTTLSIKDAQHNNALHYALCWR